MTPWPSKNLPVRVYHNILIWPLLLRGSFQADGEDRSDIQRWVQEFARIGWADETTADGSVSAAFTYEETVYFHPFVRDFLFGDGRTSAQDRIARRMTRADVRSVTVDAGWYPYGTDGVSPAALTLRVERVELYVCKPNIALLCVEVSTRKPEAKAFAAADYTPVNLADLLNFQDRFRRIYPPFWWDTDANGDEAKSPGFCPLKVVWNAPADKPPSPPASGGEYATTAHTPTTRRGNFATFTRTGAEPPVFDHWHHFFGHIQPLARTYDDRHAQPGELYYQQILDERIPAMSFFAVDSPRDVSEGDFDRITFFDAPGDDSHPYNPEFLKRDRAKYTYDRFSHYGTTYVCSGYGFAAVGGYDLHEERPFYCKVIRGHFQRHYFRMGLLAHYQRAALLLFADDLAAAIKRLEGKGPSEELKDRDFREHIEALQMRFLKFRSRSYFPEVTNQLQGQELYRFWWGHLGIEWLFKIVDETSQRLYEALAENESRTLTRVATYGVPASVVLSLLSACLSIMQVVESHSQGWVIALSILTVVLTVLLIMWVRLGGFRTKRGPLAREIDRYRNGE